MEIIDYIKELCEKSNSDYVFMHEEANMVNIKVDALHRGDRFVYVEATRTGSYAQNIYGIKTKSLQLRIFFCKFTFFGNDMRANYLPGGRVNTIEKKIETVLDEIESEIVNNFVNRIQQPEALKRLNFGRPFDRINFQYPPSRYDGNEVSVMLELTIIEPVC